MPGSPSKMVNESSDFNTDARVSEGGFLEFFLTPTDKRNLSEWLKPVRAPWLATRPDGTLSHA